MNNAELLLKTVHNAGIEICFANYGTTEIPIVEAFDTVNGIRPVMCLYEGVCAGAADGWARMKVKAAMTLLHLGPGLANALSILHNARRAATPVFNLVGEHDSWHVQADPPLAMDIDALSGTVSGWCRRIEEPGETAEGAARAVAAANSGQIATLIFPHNFQTAKANSGRMPVYQPEMPQLDLDKIKKAAALLTGGGKVGLLLGGKALSAEGLRIAARIEAKSNCDLLAPTFPARIERGGGLPNLKRLPYFAEAEADFLKGYDALIIAGTGRPVAFFVKQGVDSYLGTKSKPVLQISGLRQDTIEALERLSSAIKAPHFKEPVHASIDPPVIPGKLNAESACHTLAMVQPEGAIIVDEGLSSSMTYYFVSRNAPPHTLLTIVGGALGYGMPCSIGAAMACPDRPVINYEADGSAMYAIQALWTQARENLNITTLIASNRKYNILQMEADRAQVKFGTKARTLTEITDPEIEWVKLAEALGVPGVCVETTESLAFEINRALEEKGPHLIEMDFE